MPSQGGVQIIYNFLIFSGLEVLEITNERREWMEGVRCYYLYLGGLYPVAVGGI